MFDTLNAVFGTSGHVNTKLSPMANPAHSPKFQIPRPSPKTGGTTVSKMVSPPASRWGGGSGGTSSAKK